MPDPVGPDDPGLAFLGRLAHDLRGPLSPLQTAAYLLRREEIGPERRRELLDIIDRQSTRLGSMLQEMSDWMRVRKGSVGTRRGPVNVALLIELACAELVAAGGIVDLPAELDEAEVFGDTQHLVQMLATLVGYMQGRSGKVGVGVRASLGEGRLRVVIESQSADGNTAAWTSFADSMDTLFTAPEPAPFDEGLGLRLLIAGGIAEVHGGKISATAPAEGHIRLVIDLPLLASTA